MTNAIEWQGWHARALRGESRPEIVNGALVLHAETPWIITGSERTIGVLSDALTGFVSPVAPGVVLVNFGNAVGRFAVSDAGFVESRSGKWGEADFEQMLGDIMRVATALPFSVGAAAALPFERAVVAREDVLYHAFVYLRHIMSRSSPIPDRLQTAVEAILREPHRRLQRVRRFVPVGLAADMDVRALVGWVTATERVTVATRTAERMPSGLGRSVPLNVDEPQSRATIDTPENRFVKLFLEQAASLVGRMRRAIDERRLPAQFRARLRVDCEQLLRQLAALLGDPLWVEVGRARLVPSASPVLQGRRGYRDVFRHYSRLRLAARIPLTTADTLRLLEAKDIALLYELWCYFQVVDAVMRRLGPPAEADGPRSDAFALGVPFDIGVRWSNGTRVLYNPRFSRSAKEDRRSYSLPLRPDIGLLAPTSTGIALHLLDAKFKLDRLDDVLPSDGSDMDEALAAEERAGTFKRGDLYKMHTYKDAIPAARSVWILYPGDRFGFFGPDLHLENGRELPGQPVGVGAVPLAPLSDVDTLENVLQAILST